MQTENVGQSTVDEQLVTRIADVVEQRLTAAQASVSGATALQASGQYKAISSFSLPFSLPGHAASADISAAEAPGVVEEDQAATFSFPRIPSLPSLPQLSVGREELRLDVDGRYPQNVASGTQRSGLTQLVHWIANLNPTGARRPPSATRPWTCA